MYITYPCLQRVKASAEVKKELQRQLAEWIKEDETVKEMLIMTQDYIKKNSITEQEAVVMVSRQFCLHVVTAKTSKPSAKLCRTQYCGPFCCSQCRS